MKKHEEILKNTHLGPKRRVWHRLGPFSSSPHSISLPVAYFVDYGPVHGIKY